MVKVEYILRRTPFFYLIVVLIEVQRYFKRKISLRHMISKMNHKNDGNPLYLGVKRISYTLLPTTCADFCIITKWFLLQIHFVISCTYTWKSFMIQPHRCKEFYFGSQVELMVLKRILQNTKKRKCISHTHDVFLVYVN